MSKALILLLIAILGGLIYFGVIEIRFHKPTDVGSVSGAANTIIKEKTTLEKGRAYLISLKRRGELLFIRDKEKRLVLALLYVKNDASRLQELMAAGTSPESLLPQAELLVSSLNRVRTAAEKAPVEVVASMKQESAAAFAAAQRALSNLREENEEYETIRDEFNRLTVSLEEQIGALGLPGEAESKNDSTPAEDTPGKTD